VVPGFHCPFLLRMPLSMTPGRLDHRKFQTSMPTSPSPRSERLGTPNPPAIRSTRVKYFGASRFTYLLRPARLLAPPARIRLGHPSPRGLLLPGFQRIGCPPRWYDYNSEWTPLLAGLSPARMSVSLAAPDPYLQFSHIRSPPRVLTIKHCGLTYASQSRPRVLSPVRACWFAFPLAPALRSTDSAAEATGVGRGQIHHVREPVANRALLND
jgi:hypothetical protein